MRKFCLICALLLCGYFACRSFEPAASSASEGFRADGRRGVAELLMDDTAEQLDCQHRCNSDLKLPSPPSVENAPRAETQLRVMWGCDRRTVRGRAPRNMRSADDYAVERSVYRFGAGACAADYYVRALRRLII